MPQRIIKQITVPDHPLAVPTAAALPGLLITILTGAGWIDVALSIVVTNTVTGAYAARATLILDGVTVPTNQHGSQLFKAAEYDIPNICLRASYRLGAGTHTIAAAASADVAGPVINSFQGFLTVTELGF